MSAVAEEAEALTAVAAVEAGRMAAEGAAIPAVTTDRPLAH
jgi:hypothetical protein